MKADDEDVRNPSSPLHSEGLFCPHCDYDLTGLPEDRCPECGEQFNREELLPWREMANDQNAILRGTWSSHQFIVDVFLDSLFCPRLLALALCPQPSLIMSIIYGLLTRLLVFMAGLVASLIVDLPDQGLFLFAIALGLLTSMMGEGLIAAVLSRYVSPLLVPPRKRYRFWLAICQCFSGHLISPCLLIGLFLVMTSTISNSVAVAFIFAIIIPLLLLCLVWWWHHLAQAIIARSRHSLSRTVIICLLPIIGGIGTAAIFVPLIMLIFNYC